MENSKLPSIFTGLAVFLGVLTAPLALAQAEEMDTSIGQVGEEVFAAGETFSIGGNKGLAFAAGNTVTITDPTGGLVATGNTVTVEKGVNGPVIIGGNTVSISGPVTGSIYAGGQNVLIDVEHSGGTILAGGSNLEFAGTTEGSVYLAGDNIRIDGNIAGDAYVTGSNLSIADSAVIGGEVVYELDNGANIDIPSGIQSREVTSSEMKEEWKDETGGFGFGGAIIGFFIALIVGAIVLALMGRQSDHLANWLTKRPIQTVLTGFVGLSFWMGLILTALAIVFAIASGISWIFLILLVLVPIVMLGGFVLMVVGYVQGAHAVGSMASRFLPIDSLSPIAVRILSLAVVLLVLALVSLLLPDFASLLSGVLLMLGLGTLGLRIWKGHVAA